MTEVLIILFLGGLIAWAAVKSVRKAKTGGGCCGGHEAAAAKVTVADRRKAHYPYEVLLDIGGMTCENCARKVENALNGLEGTWASVSISSRQAKIRLKTPPDEARLRQTVQQAGYVVTNYRADGKSYAPPE